MLYSVLVLPDSDVVTVWTGDSCLTTMRREMVPTFTAACEEACRAAVRQAALALRSDTDEDAGRCGQLRHRDDDVAGG